MATVVITMTHADGTVLDTSTTTMPDAVLDLGIAAVAAAYNWTETVPNPDYVTPVVDETIPQTIANPVTAARHLAYQWRLFTTDHVKYYSQKQLASAQAALDSQVAEMESQVVVN